MMLSRVFGAATWLQRELQIILGGLLCGLKRCCRRQISVYSRVRQAHAPRMSASPGRMIASVCRPAQGLSTQSFVV